MQVNENPIEVDLRRSKRQAKAKVFPRKRRRPAKRRRPKRRRRKLLPLKTLQGKLDAANAAIKAEDYETAITNLTEANQVDPSRDVLWYRLRMLPALGQHSDRPRRKAKTL